MLFMQSAPLVLNELVRFGLVGSYSILAGAAGLHRSVTWVHALPGVLLQEHQPARGELILLIPPYADLPAQLQRLAQCESAGVGLLQPELSEELRQWADAVPFPLIQLPADADLLQVQRNLLRLLVDKEAGLLIRRAEIYQHLTELSKENYGIEALARALAEITRKGILIHDKRLHVLAQVPPAEGESAWAQILEWTSFSENLPAELQDRKRAAEISESLEQPMPGGGVRLLVPIIANQMARGFLSIVSIHGQFDQLDCIAIEQGAAACALEMAKVKAVSEARKQLTGDLIEAVLASSVNEIDAARWAERARYRRTGPHVALAMQWAPREAPSMRRLETIVSGELKRVPSRAVAQRREAEVVVFYALNPERGLADAQQWAQRVYELAQAEFPRAALAIGLGRPSETLLGLRHSYHEAAQAMALEHKLRHKRPQYFGDLGIYRLLLQLEASPELRSFSDEMLGPLIEYDRTQGTNLLATLNAYFQHNANLAQTAQALYIHRNTLLYRLQRASEIGKFDLESAETRLAIQLALRAYELSREESDLCPPLHAGARTTESQDKED